MPVARRNVHRDELTLVQVRVRAMEVLAIVVQHDVVAVRGALTQPPLTLLTRVIELLLKEDPTGLPEQASDVLRALVDPETLDGGADAPASKNAFLEKFYDLFIERAVAAIGAAGRAYEALAAPAGAAGGGGAADGATHAPGAAEPVQASAAQEPANGADATSHAAPARRDNTSATAEALNSQQAHAAHGSSADVQKQEAAEGDGMVTPPHATGTARTTPPRPDGSSDSAMADGTSIGSTEGGGAQSDVYAGPMPAVSAAAAAADAARSGGGAANGAAMQHASDSAAVALARQSENGRVAPAAGAAQLQHSGAAPDAAATDDAVANGTATEHAGSGANALRQPASPANGSAALDVQQQAQRALAPRRPDSHAMAAADTSAPAQQSQAAASPPAGSGALAEAHAAGPPADPAHSQPQPPHQQQLHQQSQQPGAPGAHALVLVLELLQHCIAHHAHQIKYAVLKHNLMHKVFKLLRAPKKWLAVAALRFFRACVALNEQFYCRLIIKHSMFTEPLAAYLRNGPQRTDLFSSTFLEMVDFIRANVRPQLHHFEHPGSSL